MAAIERCVQLTRGLSALTAIFALAAGLPYALWRTIGWPLPSRIPTSPELQAWLLAPLGEHALLNILAVACWLAWLAFVIDLGRCTIRLARTITWPPSRPALYLPHGLAAVLVGAVVVALLQHRPAAAGHVPAVQTGHSQQGDGAEPSSKPAGVDTVLVRPPSNGVYDCLWRIADRELGDGARWPEIYRLNRGIRQSDGRALTSPHLIHPGWTLTLPTRTEPDDPRPREPRERSQPPIPPATPLPTSGTPTSSTPPTSTTAATQAPSPGQHPDQDTGRGDGGVAVGPGVVVSLGLAAAISTALLLARRRARRAYRPGSGRRDDLPEAPVVYQLRLAHLRASTPELDHTDHETPARLLAVLLAPDSLPCPPNAEERDGHQVALDLAATHGLGMVGPGALDAIRALLLTQLTADHPDGDTIIVIPESDLASLLGAAEQLPDRVRVTPDLDTALDALEAEILRRARFDPPPGSRSALDERQESAPLVLAATPPEHTARLQAILDNGSSLGIAGVLLGQWQPGATAYVDAQGTITATNPGPAEHLRGTRLYTLPIAETADLLRLLHRADQGPTAPLEVVDPSDAPDAAQPPTIDPPTLTEAKGTLPPPSADADADAEQHALPLRLAVLGNVRLHHRDTDTLIDLTAKQREVLAFLALHPDGVRRDALVAAIWPNAPRNRPANALHATLSQLRRTVATATNDTVDHITTQHDGTYQLDPNVVATDYRRFQAVRSRRTGNADHIDTATQAVELYRGDFASDITAEWTTTPRETIRRDILDTLATLIHTHRDTAPEHALALLEHARHIDPINEHIYRDIIRTQARLGHHESIPRTLDLLTTALAEFDLHPTDDTLRLAETLQHPSRRRIA